MPYDKTQKAADWNDKAPVKEYQGLPVTREAKRHEQILP